MAWKISRKDYYIRLERNSDGYYHDYHSKEFCVRKKHIGDTIYSFYHNHSGMPTLFLDKVPFADIIDGSTNLPFASVQAWEDWYQLNTGQWGAMTQVTQQIEYASALTSYCDVSGNIVAFGTIKFDENTGLETAVYYDANLNTIAYLPVGSVPCNCKELDLVIEEWLPVCKNGVQYFLQVRNIVDNKTGANQSSTEVWIDKTRAIVAPVAVPYEIGYCSEFETDNYETTPIAYCYDGVTYYVSQEYTVDNETGTRTLLNTYYRNSTGVVTVEPTFTVKTIGACQFNIQENAGIERWVRLDSSTPTQSISTAQLNDRLYDTLSVSNMTPYSGDGDFRPFRGQDPQNTTVIWLEVTFFDPLTSSNYNVWYSVPSGTKLIQMEGNNIEVKAFSNGSAPSTPVNLLFTFNLSV
jgi:hypothetical protein